MPSLRPRALTSVLAATLIAFAVLRPLAAEADNSYLDADPKPRSETSLEPSRVTVAFHDSIPRSAATIVVRDASGKDVSNGAYQVEANNIYVNLAYPFPRGTYTVYYRVADRNGTPFGGQYQFSYGPGDFTANSTKTWRGQSHIPKVLALPTDVGGGAGPSTVAPSDSPDTATPTDGPSVTAPNGDSTGAADDSRVASDTASSDRSLWIAAVLLALILLGGGVMVARKRHA